MNKAKKIMEFVGDKTSSVASQSFSDDKNQEMYDLLQMAYDYFTDNERQPPNRKLAMWLKRAENLFRSISM